MCFGYNVHDEVRYMDERIQKYAKLYLEDAISEVELQSWLSTTYIDDMDFVYKLMDSIEKVIYCYDSKHHKNEIMKVLLERGIIQG